MWLSCNLLGFKGKFNRECQEFTINQHFSIGPNTTFPFTTNVLNRWFCLEQAFLSPHYDECRCCNVRCEKYIAWISHFWLSANFRSDLLSRVLEQFRQQIIEWLTPGGNMLHTVLMSSFSVFFHESFTGLTQEKIKNSNSKKREIADLFVRSVTDLMSRLFCRKCQKKLGLRRQISKINQGV